MIVLEQRYMEQVPRLLHNLLDQLEQLNKEVAELKEELKRKNEE
jgi:cell division septum initiation protein DivIVA